MANSVENFLRTSRTYVKTMGELDSDYDYLEIGDVIVEFLERSYYLSELFEIVEERGIDASQQAVNKTVKQIEVSREWLLGDKEKKDRIVQKINSFSSRGYRNFLLYGIESLQNDGIETWEQVANNGLDNFEKIKDDFDEFPGAKLLFQALERIKEELREKSVALEKSEKENRKLKRDIRKLKQSILNAIK